MSKILSLPREFISNLSEAFEASFAKIEEAKASQTEVGQALHCEKPPANINANQDQFVRGDSPYSSRTKKKGVKVKVHSWE